MRCELIIFDCDGVLVDSEPIINRAHADIMTACGCPVGAAELLERFRGIADSEMVRVLEAEWGKALPTNYPKRVAARIARDYRRSLWPVTGIAELIHGLGVPVCVASSSCPEQLRLALDVTGLLDRFGSHIYSALMVPRGKPAPDLFLYAAAQLIARGAAAAADNVSALADVFGRLGVPIGRAGDRDGCVRRYISANSLRVTSGET